MPRPAARSTSLNPSLVSVFIFSDILHTFSPAGRRPRDRSAAAHAFWGLLRRWCKCNLELVPSRVLSRNDSH